MTREYLSAEGVLAHYRGNQAKADDAMKLAEEEGRRGLKT